MEEKTINQLEAVREAIKISEDVNLECEVIVWAMKAIQKNPELTIREAIDIGLKEWVK